MDWVELIAELGRLGYTQVRIADECDTKQSTISDLARGETTDPRDSLGQKLRGLLARAQSEAEKAGA